MRLPAMLLLYSVGRRGQAATTMDDPRAAGRGRNERMSGLGRALQPKSKMPEMPEWLEREKRIKSKTSAVCGTSPCQVLVAHHHRDTPPSDQGKKVPEIFFFFFDRNNISIMIVIVTFKNH